MWMDVNEVKPETSNVIPRGTIVPLKLVIEDTMTAQSGANMLKVYYEVVSGDYENRRIYDYILTSFGPYEGETTKNGENKAEFLRAKVARLVAGMINSGNGLAEDDMSAEAVALRSLQDPTDLSGLFFCGKTAQEKRPDGEVGHKLGRPVVMGQPGWIDMRTHNLQWRSRQLAQASASSQSVGLDDEIPF